MSLGLGFTALIIFLLVWPVKITISYNRVAGIRGQVRLRAALLSGLVNLDRELPGWLAVGEGFKRSLEALAWRPTDPWWAFLHFFRTELARLAVPHKVGRYLLKRIRFTRFSLRAAIGTGDAALTAIVLGLLWSVLGPAASLASWTKQMVNPPKLELFPMYHRKALDVDFECIAFVRPIHAIFAVLLYLIYRKRDSHKASRGGRVDCQNIQSRA